MKTTRLLKRSLAYYWQTNLVVVLGVAIAVSVLAGALLAGLGGKAASSAEALAFMASHAVSRPVVVDVTSDNTSSVLETAARQGFDVVLANKKPLADGWEERVPLHQLFPLLVHACLFGGGYGARAGDMARRLL